MLCEKGRIEEGQPQVFANVVYKMGGPNLILFSIPKIRIRADLIEFTDVPEPLLEEAKTVAVKSARRSRAASAPAGVK